MNKVVFLMRDFRMGGGEKSTVFLMNQLDRSRFNISVIVLDDAGPLKDELASDVNLVSLNSSQGNAFQFLPRQISLSRKLRTILKKIDPDVVVGTSWFLNLTAAKIVCDIHSMNARLLLVNHNPVRNLVFRSTCFGLLAPVKRLITGISLRRADKVIAITDIMRDDLKEVLKLSDSSVVVICNGISCGSTMEAARSADISDMTTPYFVSVGRLEYEKGGDLLLQAFEKISHLLPHRLLIIGDGSMRKNLEQQAERAHLAGKVCFIGELPNPYPVMKQSDFLVLSSRWDAFPYVILESLALELPIISTDCDGPVKILGNGEYGLLVKRGAVTELADAMLRFATDSSLRDSYKLRSFARAMDFDSCAMIKQYESLFCDSEC